MTKQELNKTIGTLKLAEDALLDLDLGIQEKMAENDLDTLHTANVLSEILGYLLDILEETS